MRRDVIFFIIMKIGELGKYLTDRRKSLRVNQRELAKMCGISEHALCNLERGEGNPTFDLISSVAEVLGLDLILKPKNFEV